MLYIFIMVIHIIACLMLIAVILLQAGRGSGLNEAIGGDSGQSVLGTQAPSVLKKATTFSAVAFLVTSLLLGVVTARKGRSLMAQAGLSEFPDIQEVSTTAPVEMPENVDLPPVEPLTGANK